MTSAPISNATRPNVTWTWRRLSLTLSAPASASTGVSGLGSWVSLEWAALLWRGLELKSRNLRQYDEAARRQGHVRLTSERQLLLLVTFS